MKRKLILFLSIFACAGALCAANNSKVHHVNAVDAEIEIKAEDYPSLPIESPEGVSLYAGNNFEKNDSIFILKGITGGCTFTVDTAKYTKITSIVIPDGTSLDRINTNGTGWELENSGAKWTADENDVTSVTLSPKSTAMPKSGSLSFASFTVYAAPKSKIKVTVESSNVNAGKVSDNVEVDLGESAIVTATPYAGYKFDGWYAASSFISSDNPFEFYPTENVTLTAFFSAKSYNITYKDQGNVNFSGTHESDYPTTHTYGADTTLKGATKTGYTFGGWYTSSDCSGSAITKLGATSYSSDINLYAKWEASGDYKPTTLSQIGGWIMHQGKKQQIIAFGFKVNSTVYNSLVDNSDFGIVAYQNSSEPVEYANGTLDDLKANDGRFYMYIIVDSNVSVKYYAKAFVKFNGSYIYSDIVNATGDLSGTEYTL